MRLGSFMEQKDVYGEEMKCAGLVSHICSLNRRCFAPPTHETGVNLWGDLKLLQLIGIRKEEGTKKTTDDAIYNYGVNWSPLFQLSCPTQAFTCTN